MLTFNNKIVLSGDKWIERALPPIPANTIRLRYKAGTVPTVYRTKATKSCVDANNNIWDVTYNNSNWDWLFIGSVAQSNDDLVEVLGGNTSGVTSMNFLFRNATSLVKVALFDTSNVTSMEQSFAYCQALTSVPLFNTINVTNMHATFWVCSSLTSIPLFDTSKVTDIGSAFWDCGNVTGGALALYQQAATQANPPSTHNLTFRRCGSNTVTGAAELAQIPSDWK